MKTIFNIWKSFKDGFVDDFIYNIDYSPVPTMIGILFNIAFPASVIVYIKLFIFSKYNVNGFIEFMDAKFNFFVNLGFFRTFLVIAGLLVFIVLLLVLSFIIFKFILAVIAGFKNIEK